MPWAKAPKASPLPWRTLGSGQRVDGAVVVVAPRVAPVGGGGDSLRGEDRGLRAFFGFRKKPREMRQSLHVMSL